MRQYTILFCLLISCSLMAQNRYGSSKYNTKIRGNKEVVTDQRRSEDFTKVSVCCKITVELTEDEETGIEVEAESNVIEYIETEVRDGRLVVGIAKGVNLQTKKEVVVRVKMPELTSAHAGSGSSLMTMTPFLGEELRLRVNSGAEMVVAYKGDRVDVAASSGGHLKLLGGSQTAKASASSGGHVRGGRFTAERVEAKASSGGHVSLEVTETIEASASSGGRVSYGNSASEVDVRTSSGGSVRRN